MLSAEVPLSALPPWKRALLARLTSRQFLPTDRFWFRPAMIMTEAGLVPDAWQEVVLRSTSRQVLLTCTRQAGKSTVTGALAVQTAIVEAPALILLLSPTLRQSGELFRDKVLPVFSRLGWPMKARQKTTLSLELVNGSRIISLPENEQGIRDYSSVSLLIIDEASRVSDSLYNAVRPMLAVSPGRLLALSTPFGKRGWFYEEWANGGDAWQRFSVPASMCRRISPEFLEQERRSLGERWWRQEYCLSFEDAIDAVFSESEIQAALSYAVQPL